MARDDWTGWRLLLVVWVVARLPMLLAAAFWLRDEIVSALERIVGLGAPTVIAISLVSTWPERALLFVPLAGTLAAGFLLAGRARSSALRFGLPIATAALGLVVVFVLFPRPWGLVLACALLLLIVPSVLPGGAIAAWIEAPGGRRIADVVFGLGVGVAEIALFKPLLIWLGTRLRSAREGLRWARSAPARLAMAAIVPGLAVLLLQGASLDGLRRALHADPAVAQMAEGNVYALEIDTERGILYASGKGFDHLQAFDVSGGGAAPRRSAARTGYAQDFALNLDDAEIYVYDKVTRSLVVLDAPSLETKQLFAGLDVSPGDSNIAWEPRLRRILIVSEADEEQVLPDGTLAREPGIPFVGLDRASGEIVNRLPFDPGNVLIHRDAPRVVHELLPAHPGGARVRPGRGDRPQPGGDGRSARSDGLRCAYRRAAGDVAPALGGAPVRRRPPDAERPDSRRLRGARTHHRSRPRLARLWQHRQQRTQRDRSRHLAADCPLLRGAVDPHGQARSGARHGVRVRDQRALQRPVRRAAGPLELQVSPLGDEPVDGIVRVEMAVLAERPLRPGAQRRLPGRERFSRSWEDPFRLSWRLRASKPRSSPISSRNEACMAAWVRLAVSNGKEGRCCSKPLVAGLAR